eukprot:TRINITY_DN3902_c0_g1_i1.p1 TRINITY_DN3902_c0_g1~~TRINITY_DN3902_c0_g1_i1.p1  ORF type:complete len:624 (-),score=196.95 TRINITY_DN3902_c0_g1_i1:9-1880(-)
MEREGDEPDFKRRRRQSSASIPILRVSSENSHSSSQSNDLKIIDCSNSNSKEEKEQDEATKVENALKEKENWRKMTGRGAELFILDSGFRLDSDDWYLSPAFHSQPSKLLRETDWSKNPLGPIQQWPLSFRSVISMALTTKIPTFFYLGKELVTLYNDGAMNMFLEKHPSMWGVPMSIVWEETWEGVVGPMISGVINSGNGIYCEDMLLILKRGDFLQEMYFTFSYSPVTEGPHVLGIKVTLLDTSERVYGRRQLQSMTKINQSKRIESLEESDPLFQSWFAECPYDVPVFGLYHLNSSGELRLFSHSFNQSDISLFPNKINPNAPSSSLVVESKANGNDKELEERSDFKEGIRKVIMEPFSTKVFAKFLVPTGEKFVPPSYGHWKTPITRWAAFPFEDGKGNIVGIFLCGMNQHRKLVGSYFNFLELVTAQIETITLEAKNSQEAKRRQKALEKLDKDRTNFFQSISHEFKTPITLMLGPLEQINEREKEMCMGLTKEHHHRLDITYRNVLRLLKLVDNLLNFERLEKGEMKAKMELTDLSGLTTSIASLFAPACQERNISMSIECEPVSNVYVDQSMWEDILTNILSNSFKYTNEGAIKVKIFSQTSCQIVLNTRMKERLK